MLLDYFIEIETFCLFRKRGEVTDLVPLDASKMDNKWNRSKKELGRRARAGGTLSRGRFVVTVLGQGRF